MAWRVVCDSGELVIECAHAAQKVGLKVEPEFCVEWFQKAAHYLAKGDSIAIALAEAPPLEQLVQLSREASTGKLTVALAVVGAGETAQRTLDAAGDLGIAGVSEIGPLVGVLALVGGRAAAPWSASIRALPAPDRARLRSAIAHGARVRGQLTREKAGLIAWSAEEGAAPVLIGEPGEAARAIAALHAADRAATNLESTVEGVDQQAVTEVIFGPRRALSGPASKAALLAYGMTMPVEELCSSASRAAAEASRIGFPVRVALASPDLRIWDHPDLAVDQIDNAARVREVFGILTGLAKSRASDSRLLGVTVAAANQAVALLEVRARPLPYGRICMEIGFADPHGKASSDVTTAILPATMSGIERVLGRLRGSSLILGSSKAQRRRNLESVGDTLLRLAAFVNDRAKQLEGVDLIPLALLVDGSVEIREACITVNDAFERSIDVPGEPVEARPFGTTWPLKTLK